MLTPHDERCHIGFNGIRTCDHPHPSPELYLYHYAMGIDTFFFRTPSDEMQQLCVFYSETTQMESLSPWVPWFLQLPTNPISKHSSHLWFMGTAGAKLQGTGLWRNRDAIVPDSHRKQQFWILWEEVWRIINWNECCLTWANEMNFVMNHAPSAGSITLMMVL